MWRRQGRNVAVPHPRLVTIQSSMLNNITNNITINERRVGVASIN